ncbi:MAG TPA: hypothetical protein DD638_09045 [Pasteurellaceae bacterium]|nr:hypothetical protein [Pasteurellaceae bacterium]
MNKVITILFLFLAIPMSYGMTCISDKENSVIIEQINSLNENYGNVPNMADCKKTSALNTLVCSDPKLRNALWLLSMGSVYAYENATHTPVPNHSTYNNDYMLRLNNMIIKESDKSAALRKLCFIVKNDTLNYIGSFGVDEPAYIDISDGSHLFFLQENNSGIVLQNEHKNIYLGVSCDVADSTGKKGRWYKDKDKYIVELNGEKYSFNRNNNGFKLNCEKP